MRPGPLPRRVRGNCRTALSESCFRGEFGTLGIPVVSDDPFGSYDVGGVAMAIVGEVVVGGGVEFMRLVS